MAQRYPPGIAHDRMAQYLCPECGRAPDVHTTDNRFWMPAAQACDLRVDGVVDRIMQYETDAQLASLGPTDSPPFEDPPVDYEPQDPWLPDGVHGRDL